MLSARSINQIKDTFPELNAELIACVELALGVTDKLVQQAATKTGQAMGHRDFATVQQLAQLSQDVSAAEDGLREFAALLAGVSPATAPTPAPQGLGHSVGEDFTSTKPIGFCLRQAPFVRATSWQELMVRVCEQLLSEDATAFMQACTTPEVSRRFSKNPNELRIPKSVGGRIYVDTHSNATEHVRMAGKLLAAFGWAERDITIYLRDPE